MKSPFATMHPLALVLIVMALGKMWALWKLKSVCRDHAAKIKADQMERELRTITISTRILYLIFVVPGFWIGFSTSWSQPLPVVLVSLAQAVYFSTLGWQSYVRINF